MCSQNYKELSQYIYKFTRDNNVTVGFKNDSCFVKDKKSSTVLLQGTLRNGLYQLQLPSDNSSNCYPTSTNSLYQSLTNKNTKHVKVNRCKNSSFVVNKIDVDVWYKRFGHPWEKTTKHIFKSSQLHANFQNFNFCKDCHFGKHHQGHFSISHSKATKPLKLMHSNVWGLAPVFIVECEVCQRAKYEATSPAGLL